ncbi:valine--tRNA ligase [Ancylobacter defluvii]|uniref:Valine--tRNA ligase n=1 Tax=Ancylobacter defluvii TaxID=1282440 RepID=A0A9W6JVV5_9HYPH|nr:valine--tRNA ligase [Ancylobacter defluvii]MBS7587891.1 valine--tRNA ligase [Ancylobacter defluvii]GLK83571.1 valine--tRNA ligase [Ancylobacter defluvii]
MLDNRFDPAAVEGRIYQAWVEADAFKAGRPERVHAEPYCIVIPPPNVTGSLHMGHALNNTLQDVLARFERMRGKDVLWQVGTDHAGIATQMVVERQLAERQQPGRREMGRAAFVERIWAWKEESGGTIINQLKRLGASCDWSRERFTMDEGLSRAVLKVFVRLYKQGLIYKDKRLVNWDPKFQSAISDLEVVQVEVKGHLWHFRYPLDGGVTYQHPVAFDEAGRPTEYETRDYIVVATTRPETMLGDTAVAVHPDDERYRGLVGTFVRLPLVGRLVPIVADAYSDPTKGTGAVKITPAHDFNDFEVGKRAGVPMINVLDAEARLTLSGNAEFLEGAVEGPDLDAVLALSGHSREAARKAIVALMDERGLLDKIEPHAHTVPHGDRSNVVIEPWLTDQWYVDAHTLAQPALKAVRDGRTSFVPKNWEKTYFEWLENIQPWCISRQLWWGHQIPAWYGPDGSVFVEETEEAALASALAHCVQAGIITDEQARDYAKHPEKAGGLITRDEDVLDTWFSSALWPFSTLGWPDQTRELERFYPTSVLITGFDIIFFWVARMMMMGLHFMDGEIPFKHVYIHALVRDEKGAKMSKSKGNVIDPLSLIEEYGADALRFTLAAMAAQGRDIKLATSRVEGYRNFATKLWNAARFAEMNGCTRVPTYEPKKVELAVNRWILSELQQAQEDITAGIEAYRFNEAAGAAYRFVWNIFCDWYLELAKPVFMNADNPWQAETRATTAFVLDEILKLLHPFMPFLTEELWKLTAGEGLRRPAMLALTQWPKLSGLKAPAAAQEIGWLIDLVTEIRSVRAEMNVPAGAQIPLVLVDASSLTQTRTEVWMDALTRLARLSGVTFADAAPAGAVQVVVQGETAALPLAGIIDMDAEVVRLTKELGKTHDELDKIEKKLGNPDFIARAKEEVIDEQRERRDAAQARAAKIVDALGRLGKVG